MYGKLMALLLLISGASAGVAEKSEAESKRITLVAEITITNGTNSSINGYVHRLALPVEGHMQQSLLAIRHDGVESFEKKSLKDDNGSYIELEWDIPKQSKSIKKVYFDLLVKPYNLAGGSNKRRLFTQSSAQNAAYLQPQRYIESNAEEVVKLARHIQHSFSDPESRLRAAFLTPQQIIQYRNQPTKGALYAISARQGDCTEYATLFVALARAMGYPARTTSEFLFTEHRGFSQPNHHAAEVYLDGRWVPVDPNLALDPSFGYGFGVGKASKVVLNRNFGWVWSNLWPRGTSDRRGEVDADMYWRIQNYSGE